MKKIIKRTLASILVALMIISAAPMSGFVGVGSKIWAGLCSFKASAEEFIDEVKDTVTDKANELKELFTSDDDLDTSSTLASSGQCGDNVYWTFDSSTGLLTISGTGYMAYYDYFFNKYSPFYNNSTIKTVVIKNSVTGIGEWAFSGCAGLTSITIPDSVTSIGRYAFCGCTSLTSITIPDSVTSIGECAFDGCTGLTSITIGNGVTSIGCGVFCYTAYYNNSNNWDNNILYIGNYLIEAKASLSGSYTIKNGTKAIADYAFECRTDLTSITIPNGVTSIGGWAFCDCIGLTSITIPDSVTSIGYGAFIDCTSLTSITIPDSVTSIGGCAFYVCTGLTSVTIGNNVTSIGVSAFHDCTGLTSITIPNSVTSIDGFAFEGCTSLTSITILDSVTSIGYDAFYRCTNLTSITIGNSVTSIGNYAFYGCTGLKDVYYTGSEAQWKNISIGSNNECLTNATIHYNYSGTEESDEAITKFISEHINYYNQNKDLWLNNGFSNNISESKLKTHMITDRIYDSLKDAGEVATFKFDDLQITADYYDIYLSDLMLAFSESTASEEIELKANEYYETGFDSITNFLKSSEKYKDLSDSFKIETAFASDYDISDSMKATFETVFKDAYKNHKDLFKDIYQGFDCADEVCSVIDTGLDAFNTFRECYQAYCIAKATKQVNNDFFNYCYDSANELAKTNQKFANWFKEDIDKFKNQSQSDADLFLAVKAASKGGYLLYDTFIKNFANNAAYNLTAKVLGTTLGKVVAVITAWNVGLAIGGLIAKTDTEGTYYLYYISPVEKAMETVFTQYANSMKSNNTYESAQKYEVAFTTLKYTNITLYNKAYQCASNQSIFGFKSKSVKNDMEATTYLQNCWNSYSCHGTNYSSNQFKSLGVHCPVDVYLYNNNNELVLSIVDEEIEEYNDTNIVVNICDGHKSISYPTDKDYRIKIIARTGGTMDYYVTTVNGDEIREVEATNINLISGQIFSGTIPENQNADISQFELTSNGTKIEMDSDSTNIVHSVTINNAIIQINESLTVNPVIYADTYVKYATTWLSSNTSVATVDSNGKVTGVKAGTATITCTVTDEYGNTVSDTCTITVIDNSTISSDVIFSLTLVSETDTEVKVAINLEKGYFSCIDATIIYSDSLQLKSFTKSQKFKSVDMEDDNLLASTNAKTGKFSIANSNKYSTLGEIYILTFTKLSSDFICNNDISMIITNCAADKNINPTVINRIKNDIGKVNSVQIDDISLNYKKSTTITPKIEVDDGVTYTVKYETSNAKVATVDDNGNVTATKRGSGSAIITCTVTDQYGNTVTDDCKVTVSLSFGQKLLVYVLFGWIWY